MGIPGATIGDASVISEIGQLALDGTWLEFDAQPQFNEVPFSRPFYALSGPITVPEVPEPSTLVLAAVGSLGLWAIGRRRRG